MTETQKPSDKDHRQQITQRQAKQKFSAQVIVACIILTVIVFVIGFLTGGIRVVSQAPDPNYIPSQREIQQKLTDIGNPRYDPNGVDGVIGKDSRTAWDNFTIDQHAKRAVEGE